MYNWLAKLANEESYPTSCFEELKCLWTVSPGVNERIPLLVDQLYPHLYLITQTATSCRGCCWRCLPWVLQRHPSSSGPLPALVSQACPPVCFLSLPSWVGCFSFSLAFQSLRSSHLKGQFFESGCFLLKMSLKTVQPEARLWALKLPKCTFDVLGTLLTAAAIPGFTGWSLWRSHNCILHYSENKVASFPLGVETDSFTSGYLTVCYARLSFSYATLSTGRNNFLV